MIQVFQYFQGIFYTSWHTEKYVYILRLAEPLWVTIIYSVMYFQDMNVSRNDFQLKQEE